MACVYTHVEEAARLWAGPTKAGDASAALLDVEAAWRAHYASMVSLAALLCGSRRDAEDLVQDVFVSLHRARPDVRDLETYLRRAVVNRCRSQQRREVLARRRPEPASAWSDDLAIDTTLRRVRQLRPKQRTAVVLRFYGDLSMADVAQAMGCSPSTARSHVHRGLKALKEMLDC